MLKAIVWANILLACERCNTSRQDASLGEWEATVADNVLRVERNANYRTVNLTAVSDRRITWKAVGIHLYLVTRPDGWKFNVDDLISRKDKDGRVSVRSGVGELKEAGYLSIDRMQNDDGTFAGWQWTIREVPLTEVRETDTSVTERQVSRPTVDPKIGGPAPVVSNEGGSKGVSSSSKDSEETSRFAEEGELELVARGPAGPPVKKPADHLATDVFEYWRERRAAVIEKSGGPPMRPTQKRMGCIRARLQEGYTPGQLREAVDGCLGDEWHVENGHTDVELICRSQSHVERFRAMRNQGSARVRCKTAADMNMLASWIMPP